MTFSQTPVNAPSGQILPRDYPPPPRVHWFVLLCVFTVVKILIGIYSPLRYQSLFDSIAGDAWAFYLCLWIRSLDWDARSPFWCDVYVIVELSFVALAVRRNPSLVMTGIVAVLGLAAAILGIATIFLIRSDLERHYNEREPYGLRLSGAMTFFFSFLYFQYHLYRIAKWREAERTTNPNGTVYS